MVLRKSPFLEMHPLEAQTYLSGLFDVKREQCEDAMPTYLAYFWHEDTIGSSLRKSIQKLADASIPEVLRPAIDRMCCESLSTKTRDCIWGFSLAIDEKSNFMVNACKLLSKQLFHVARQQFVDGGASATLGVHPYAGFCQLHTTEDWEFIHDLSALRKVVVTSKKTKTHAARKGKVPSVDSKMSAAKATA